MPNLATRCQYICQQIQGRSAKFGQQMSVAGDTSLVLPNLATNTSTRGYIWWQTQGRSAKFGHQMLVLGGTSASRSKVDLPNLDSRCLQGDTSESRSRVDLPNLATRCQYWGLNLLADLGQICQIQLLGVSTGQYICWQIQGRSAKFRHQVSVQGETSASTSRVELPNLATRCQYWGLNLPADVGQICQIQLLGVSTGQYICWGIQGSSAKFRHQMSVAGVHLPADVGQFCQIWPTDTSTGGTSARRSRVDLPNLATRYQYWGYIC